MASNDLFAVVPARVWDGVADSAVADQAVSVRGDVIEAILPARDVPANVRRIDLPDCTLTPGLMDAHVHYSSVMGPAFLAAGVTTIRDVGNDITWILDQRRKHADDPLVGPEILCCGHLLDGGPKPHWPRLGRGHTSTDEIRDSVREHVQRGVDQIKLYAKLTPDLFAAGVDESHKLGKFVLAHLGGTPCDVAIRAGLNEIEHLDGCPVAWRQADELEDNVFIDLLLKHHVVIDPTFVVWDRLGRVLDRSFHHDDRRRWVHPCHLDLWNRYLSRFDKPESRLQYARGVPHLKRFVRRAHARGVIVAIGTDTPFPHLVPGFCLHDELAMYVDAGLKPDDALRSATSVNASVFEIAERKGRIARGLAADFAAFRGNPLDCIDDISNVAWVCRAGMPIDIEAIKARIVQDAKQSPDDPITNDLIAYIEGRR